MRSRFPSSAQLVLVLTLACAGLTGCSTFHGWAQAGSSGSPTAGASVNIPLGK